MFDTKYLDGFEDGRNVCGAKGACHVFNAVGEGRNQCIVIQTSIYRTLKVGKLAFLGIVRKAGFPHAKSRQELWHCDITWVFPRKQSLILLLCPFVVFFGHACVPAVDEVKFCRDLITWSTSSGGPSKFGSSRIKVPVTVGPVEVQDRSHVVFEDAIHVETAGNETSSLEQIIVVFGVGSLICIIGGLSKPSCIID